MLQKMKLIHGMLIYYIELTISYVDGFKHFTMYFLVRFVELAITRENRKEKEHVEDKNGRL